MTMTGNISGEAARHQTGTSMMAWRVHEFGPPETMRFERVPVPTPGPGEVWSRSMPPGSVRGMAGSEVDEARFRSRSPSRWVPICPVRSRPSGQTSSAWASVIRSGDQIYGVTNPRFIGAYAEYALASAAMIARKPASLGYIEAASVPVIAVTRLAGAVRSGGADGRSDGPDSWGSWKRWRLCGADCTPCRHPLHRDGRHGRSRPCARPRRGHGG